MTLARDRSTLIIGVTFYDEAAAPTAPNSAAWSLTSGGAVVNGRSQVVIDPARSVDIVLSGGDLDADDGLTRVLTVWGTYNSERGDGLPFADEFRIKITPLEGLP